MWSSRWSGKVGAPMLRCWRGFHGTGIGNEGEAKWLFKRKRMRIRDTIGDGIGKDLVVCGWAKAFRTAKKGTMCFVDLNDGSCLQSLQVVASEEDTEGFHELMSHGSFGASFEFQGELVESPAKGQNLEFKAKRAIVLGTIDMNSYPLKKTKHSHGMEFLRSIPHLRPRTNLFGAIARVRDGAACATHDFFRSRGLKQTHTPIITGSDCEGAGDLFSVTTSHVESFFDKPTFLTVSGQLNLEAQACGALSDVYSFGPAFRAEDSNTSRHLSEFWMVEAELCFVTLRDIIDLAEDYLKTCITTILDQHEDDLDFLHGKHGHKEVLVHLVSKPFVRMTYTEAINILSKAQRNGRSFEKLVDWGIDLGSDHERFLVEDVCQGVPVIVTDYPQNLKAFYMLENEPDWKGRRTVQCMDVLAPRVGEIIGGSAREHRLDHLQDSLKRKGIDPNTMDWYCDLRRYGSVPHGGFGLGFERLLMLLTGASNVRDVIPFPRSPGNCPT